VRRFQFLVEIVVALFTFDQKTVDAQKIAIDIFLGCDLLDLVYCSRVTLYR
jgi:hypothetical protein